MDANCNGHAPFDMFHHICPQNGTLGFLGRKYLSEQHWQMRHIRLHGCICYATRINSIEDADHICNCVKPQSFVFICAEHLKCLTKIFGTELNIIFTTAISAALEITPCTIIQVDNIILAVKFQETNPVQTYIIEMGIKNLYNWITSTYIQVSLTM